MALIKCSDCGKEVSDSASSCIGCGRPIQKRGSICKHCGCDRVGKVRGLQGFEVMIFLIYFLGGLLPGIIYYIWIESVPYCSGCGKRRYNKKLIIFHIIMWCTYGIAITNSFLS